MRRTPNPPSPCHPSSNWYSSVCMARAPCCFFSASEQDSQDIMEQFEKRVNGPPAHLDARKEAKRDMAPHRKTALLPVPPLLPHCQKRGNTSDGDTLLGWSPSGIACEPVLPTPAVMRT